MRVCLLDSITKQVVNVVSLESLHKTMGILDGYGMGLDGTNQQNPKKL
jgi:hypothetical protein